MSTIFLMRDRRVDVYNMYKNDLYFDECTNIHVLNKLHERIVYDKLYIKIELFHQFQYVMYHGTLDCINITASVLCLNNQSDNSDDLIYLYTNTVVHFPMMKCTFVKIILLHYQNKSHQVQVLLEQDPYFRSCVQNFTENAMKLLYNDFMYHWKEIYFN